MIRKFLDAVDDWIVDEDNMFIGAAKLLLVASVALLLLASPFIYFETHQPTILLPKAEWVCVQSHEGHMWMMVGRTMMPVPTTVCDEYRRVQ